MQKTFFFTLLVLCSFSLAAQQKKAVIYGTVKNPSGNPAPGISVVVFGEAKGAQTGDDGNYTLAVPANKQVTIIFSTLEYKRDTIALTLKEGERHLLNVTLQPGGISLNPVDVNGGQTKEEKLREKPSAVRIPVEDAQFIPSASGGDISSLLVTTALGVGSPAGELSTTYTVRGGNYDENLVYVNDFEVFRPYLIQSGQQEGLSFVNSDMVSDLTFSSGGFEAKYGDKMASVLDCEYKTPTSFHGSVSGGLLGGTAHLEGIIKRKKDTEARATYNIGLRQKSSQYLISSLDTKGEYNPSFTDLQGFITCKINKKLTLEWIGNFALNKYSFIPTDRTTTFGEVNNVLRLNVYYDGQELDQYRTMMTGLSLVQKVNDHLKFKWMASIYGDNEQETQDITGEYYIGEVQTDLGASNFGQTLYNLGVGGMQNYNRDELNAIVANAEWRGYYTHKKHNLEWGLKYQHEIIQDRLHEWEMLDSAGYSLPYNGAGSGVNLYSYLNSTFNLNSNRYSGFLQDSWRVSEKYGVTFTYGGRFSYWNVNKEFVASPRAQISFKPLAFIHPEKDVVFTAAVGMYDQPPFYREMRDLEGNVNLNEKAQKSFQAVIGAHYNFLLWKRKFSFIAEAYYKYLYDVVPYEFDNVLIRYFGQNEAKGYAAGVDLRLNGELAKGVDSYINLSVLSTKENLNNDSYQYGVDDNGNPVPANSPLAVKHVTGYPGYIPMPTDQKVRLTMFFQDFIPKHESFKMHLNFVFATGLPFGPPVHQPYLDTLRMPAYRRVDIGFSALLFSKARREAKGKEPKSVMKYLETIWATFEVYNLLGVDNVVSYLWITDITNTSYAVPNYLSSRRINVRFVVSF